MLLTWRGARICLNSGSQRRVTAACSEWAPVWRAEDQDVSACTQLHSATARPLQAWASLFRLFWASFGTEILLETETEQSEDILLQLRRLSMFKHSGPLKSCVSVGSPNLKDQQIAGRSQRGRRKNAFSVYQLCQDWSRQVLGIKVEGRTSQRKAKMCYCQFNHVSDSLI